MDRAAGLGCSIRSTRPIRERADHGQMPSSQISRLRVGLNPGVVYGSASELSNGPAPAMIFPRSGTATLVTAPPGVSGPI